MKKKQLREKIEELILKEQALEKILHKFGKEELDCWEEILQKREQVSDKRVELNHRYKNRTDKYISKREHWKNVKADFHEVSPAWE